MKNNCLSPDRRIFPYWLGKTFRIIKISVILFLTGIISMYAGNSYSHTTRLSLDLKERIRASSILSLVTSLLMRIEK